MGVGRGGGGGGGGVGEVCQPAARPSGTRGSLKTHLPGSKVTARSLHR